MKLLYHKVLIKLEITLNTHTTIILDMGIFLQSEKKEPISKMLPVAWDGDSELLQMKESL